MLTINNTSSSYPTRDAAAIERVQARVEVSHADAARVKSIAISEGAVPGLAAGDLIYVKSEGMGAYRTVLRVEPIAGGAMMILLDPGHPTLAPPISIK